MKTMSLVIALVMLSASVFAEEGQLIAQTKDPVGKAKERSTSKNPGEAVPMESSSNPQLEALPPPVDQSAYEEWERKQWKRLNAVQRRETFRTGQLPIFGNIQMENAGGTSTAKIHLVNQAGGAFRLVKAIVYLDKFKIYDQTQDEGVINAGDQTLIFDSRLMPGTHTLSGYFVYQGHGYGIFTYMKSFMVGLKAGNQFSTFADKPTDVSMRLVESNVEDLKNRFRVAFEVK